VSVSLAHALAVWQRNASMYRRTWTWNILPNFFEPVLYLAAIGIGVGAYITEMGGTSYIQFLAPGLVCVAAMNGASFEVTYNIYVRLNFEKTYDAMLTFIVVLAFGLAPLPSSLIALPLIPLAGLLFASIGIAFSLRILTIDLFSFYFTLFLTPLFLFSDVFFPIEERLSGAWLWVAEILPLLHPVRLARGAFRGDLTILALWDLAYILAVSGLLLVWARRAARARLTT
jgi:lipooligosaccharide transport system permease protein